MLKTYLKIQSLHYDVSKTLADRKGATAIEYGLIAAGIAVVIIGAVKLLGTTLTNMFNTITNNI